MAEIIPITLAEAAMGQEYFDRQRLTTPEEFECIRIAAIGRIGLYEDSGIDSIELDKILAEQRHIENPAFLKLNGALVAYYLGLLGDYTKDMLLYVDFGAEVDLDGLQQEIDVLAEDIRTENEFFVGQRTLQMIDAIAKGRSKLTSPAPHSAGRIVY